MMFALALRSLRYRTGGFVAGFVAVFLGATFLMAFASMLDTATGGGVPAASKETLTIMATVVGGWGLILVLFAVASTLTLTVRQRATEMALLKSVGATPAQVRRMIVGETAVVALAAAVLAIFPSWLAGRQLLDMLISTGQVDRHISYGFGGFALGIGLGITFVAATLAALLTARRAARMRVTESLLEAAAGDPRTSRKRIVAAIVSLLIGLDLAVVTATVMRDQGEDAMSTAGQTSIFLAIGFALLGPVLIRRVAGRLAGPLERWAGAAGHLTALNIRQRSHQMAAALMPVILFTGIATGTLYMQHIDNAATTGVRTTSQKNIETLNFVVIGMIALFAAIMLVNTLIAATRHRGREFGQHRLCGATPGQVLQMVGLEGLVLSVTGVLFGTLAAAGTILPYGIARNDSVLPAGGPGTYLGIVAVAVVLTLAAGLGTAVRTVRTPAVAAVAV